MSRSFNKHSWVKDKPRRSGSSLKRCAHRAHRRAAKSVLDVWKDRWDIETICFGCECSLWEVNCDFICTHPGPIFPHPWDLINKYDICDWRFQDTFRREPENRKNKRIRYSSKLRALIRP